MHDETRRGRLIRRVFDLILLPLFLAFLPRAAAAESSTPEGLEFFEKKIRPLLSQRCYSCHSATAEKLKGGLRLDSRDNILKGGDTKPAILPGHPEQSLLIKAVRYEDPDLKMPPKSRLSQGEMNDLSEWVRMGAPWPKEAAAASVSKPKAFDLQARRSAHWAWKPISPRTAPPALAGLSRQSPVDAFLLAGLEKQKIQPSPRADRTTLIRRLSFDLTGLPPSRSELDSFLSDDSEQAYEKLVDRLLASPQFGERWARHWLDLVRYAETLGHEFDYPVHNAWRYRDYVVRAFNQDLPYNQFVTEHVAGDLVQSPRTNSTGYFNESIIGTSFYWLGQREHSPVDVRLHQAELIDNQIDVLTKTFLGLTVACARCHDHKFDAISANDYYALYGILGSSRYTQTSIDPPEARQAVIGQLQRIRRTLRESIAQVWLQKLREGSAPVSTGSPPPATMAPNLSRPVERVLADFQNGTPPDWFPEGEAFASPQAMPGDFMVGMSNRPVASVVSSSHVHSGTISPLLQGCLRSPTFQISHRFVHVLAAGRGSRVKLPVFGFTMICDPIYGELKKAVNHDTPRWITFKMEMWKGFQAYLELNDTSTPDPADGGSKDRNSPEGWIAIHRVVLSDEPAPAMAAPAAAGLLDPETLRKQLSGIVELWGRHEALTPDQASLLDASVRRGDFDLDPKSPAYDRIAALVQEFRKVENGLGEPRRTPSLVDGSGIDEKVFIRGNPRTPGETVPRRFLEAIAGPAPLPGIDRGSGRLQLAQQITSPENPFISRVAVNRVWLHLFGRGIVPTPDDFGALGQPPTHPELLDWLADWFRTEGAWSNKKLVRMLVLSDAYQRSSKPTDPVAESRDPSNVYWHRMPVKRLEGEALRDAVLALSDRLDLSMFGPPVPVHLTEFMEGRGRPAASGPLDGQGRRSLYLEVRRNFVSPMMRAFDTPVPFTTVGRRTLSNVPAQSLILMNDPLVVEQARRWAGNILASGPKSDRARITALYQAAFSRAPSERELAGNLAFLERQQALLAKSAPPDSIPGTAWADLCHVLLNVKEFSFVQ